MFLWEVSASLQPPGLEPFPGQEGFRDADCGTGSVRAAGRPPAKSQADPCLGPGCFFLVQTAEGRSALTRRSPSDGATASRFGSNQLLLGRRIGKIPLAITRPHSSSCLLRPGRPSSPAEIPQREAQQIFPLQLRTASLGTCGHPQPLCPVPSWAAQPEHLSPRGPGRWSHPEAAPWKAEPQAGTAGGRSRTAEADSGP